MKIVIIGGVAGGATAAARLRRNDEDAEIVLIERGPDISFANCGLPYHLSGVIAERSRLLVATPALFRERYRIDVRTRCEAVAIDRHPRSVRLRDLATGVEHDEPYDRLVLSPGAAALRPPLPGIDSHRIHTLRNLADLDGLMAGLAQAPTDRALVIGGGFIGLEVAENLHHRGLAVKIVEASSQVMAGLDPEMAALLHAELRAQGLGLHLDRRVLGFETTASGVVAQLDDGQALTADLVVLAIGVRPEAQLAKDAGLALGERGGIRVNVHLQTSDPVIYAIGDAAEVPQRVNGQPGLIPLAGPANRQGRQVADHICQGQTGRPAAAYAGSLGTSILKLFGLAAASCGFNERQARAAGMAVVCTHTHSGSHAGYYPGAHPISLKLVYTPEGRLLGAQAVGREGVDKRIDVIATALQAGLTAPQLADLELAYAPPFGSAKDPVNIAGYVAGNTLDGTHPVRHWHEVAGLGRAAVQLLDVRTRAETEAGTLPGALCIPLHTLRDRLAELDPAREVLAYCQIGLRGYLACRILAQRGFQARNLSGGYTTWHHATQGQAQDDAAQDEPLAQAFSAAPAPPAPSGG